MHIHFMVIILHCIPNLLALTEPVVLSLYNIAVYSLVCCVGHPCIIVHIMQNALTCIMHLWHDHSIVINDNNIKILFVNV
jgi:hypothetical protein